MPKRGGPHYTVYILPITFLLPKTADSWLDLQWPPLVEFSLSLTADAAFTGLCWEMWHRPPCKQWTPLPSTSNRIAASISWAKSNYVVTARGGQSGERKARDNREIKFLHSLPMWANYLNQERTHSESIQVPKSNLPVLRPQLCHVLFPLFMSLF